MRGNCRRNEREKALCRRKGKRGNCQANVARKFGLKLSGACGGGGGGGEGRGGGEETLWRGKERE